MNHLSEEEIKSIAQELYVLFKGIIDGIDPETHKRQHEFITAFMADVERKRQLREHIKKTVLGWLAITVIGGIGFLAYQYIVMTIVQAVKGGGS